MFFSSYEGPLLFRIYLWKQPFGMSGITDNISFQVFLCALPSLAATAAQHLAESCQTEG